MMMSGWNMQKFQKNFADILYIVKGLNIAKHCVNGNSDHKFFTKK